MKCDVAIIGGGPAGSTVGSLVKAQNPGLDVAIFEAAQFPRDHVGESLLPTTCEVLAELGVWDKVEAAGFPVKLGGLYRWGVSDEIYPLLFLEGNPYQDTPRPAKYEGQRTLTAFQVDRSIFDKILLDHAASRGCQVYELTSVLRIHSDGDEVTSLTIRSASGHEEQVEATTYVDASGNRSILRKALGIKIEAPTALKNIAIYDYWQGADWRVRVGVDATNIHVMSLDWGWLWFIAMGKTRTSVGLVTSADYYKKSGLTTEELYLKAIESEPLISVLLRPAIRENSLKAESDWSYIADRLAGSNWYLAGDSAGFADPILSAGATLAMTGAQKVAYSISAIHEGKLDANWIRSEYDRIQRKNIRDHIRFADYWYSVNSKFTDLQDYCGEIAREAGLNLAGEEAFRWLAIGGFSGDAGGYASPTAASFRLSSVKTMVGTLGGEKPGWLLEQHDTLRLNLHGATRETAASYVKGRIEPQESFRRGDQRLFLTGLYKRAYVMLQLEPRKDALVEKLFNYFRPRTSISDPLLLTAIVEVLEAMMVAGWVEGSEVSKMSASVSSH